MVLRHRYPRGAQVHQQTWSPHCPLRGNCILGQIYRSVQLEYVVGLISTHLHPLTMHRQCLCRWSQGGPRFWRRWTRPTADILHHRRCYRPDPLLFPSHIHPHPLAPTISWCRLGRLYSFAISSHELRRASSLSIPCRMVWSSFLPNHALPLRLLVQRKRNRSTRWYLLCWPISWNPHSWPYPSWGFRSTGWRAWLGRMALDVHHLLTHHHPRRPLGLSHYPWHARSTKPSSPESTWYRCRREKTQTCRTPISWQDAMDSSEESTY